MAFKSTSEANSLPETVVQIIRQAEAQRRAYSPEIVRDEKKPVLPPEKPGKPRIKAKPYEWIDPSLIPRRVWLYGRSLIRKFLTVTVAPGGVGKSSLAIAEALAMVTGRALLGKQVESPMNVWVWNLEDPEDELQRRIQAVCEHFDISTEDIGGRLFVDSGRDQPFCMAVSGKNGTTILRPIIDELVDELVARQVDVFIVDPFVSSHMVAENDNSGMDAVAKEWSKVADRANCAVHLIHHTRKLGSDAEVTVESSRGGKALTDAAREVRAINRMSPEESEKFGVENPRQYFRVYSDKANMAPPADISDWYFLKNIILPNGDHVGVVTEWEPPKPFDDVSLEDLYQVQKRISEGDWRADERAEHWAGKAVADVLELDLDAKGVKAKIKTLIAVWIKNDALRIEKTKDGSRHERQFLRVGQWAK